MRYVWMESNRASNPFQTRSSGHAYSVFQPRYASHIAPTIAPTWTILPRHQGTCETTGVVSARASVTVDTV